MQYTPISLDEIHLNAGIIFVGWTRHRVLIKSYLRCAVMSNQPSSKLSGLADLLMVFPAFVWISLIGKIRCQICSRYVPIIK